MGTGVFVAAPISAERSSFASIEAFWLKAKAPPPTKTTAATEITQYAVRVSRPAAVFRTTEAYKGCYVLVIVQGTAPEQAGRSMKPGEWAHIDTRFRDALKSGKNVVVYGSSKLGKTALVAFLTFAAPQL